MKKIRVCELEPGDHFEIFGMDYKVDAVMSGRIWFRKMYFAGGRAALDAKSKSDYQMSLGQQSQQFVNLISHAVNKHNKKVVERDPDIVGPAENKGSAG
jgi:hypothetical protein